MLKVRSLLWIAAILAGAVGAGAARAQDMANDPFDRAWDFEHAQAVRGNVDSIVEQNYPFDWQTRKLMEKPAFAEKLTYKDGLLVAISSVKPDGSEQPRLQIKYEKKTISQIVRTVSIGRPNTEPEIKTATETAKIGADGQIESIAVERISGEKMTVAIKTEAAADGGKTLSWSIEGPGGPPGPSASGPAASGPAGSQPAPARPTLGIVLTYDKAGRLTKRQVLRDGKPFMTAEVAYNDKGDIESVTMGASKMVYEREYDAKGNWTKMTRSMVRQASGKEVKDAQEMKSRQIKYAQ